VFGFGAFDEREIDSGARQLARVLERESSKRSASSRAGSRQDGGRTKRR
jgi:hypothetical protein